MLYFSFKYNTTWMNNSEAHEEYGSCAAVLNLTNFLYYIKFRTTNLCISMSCSVIILCCLIFLSAAKLYFLNIQLQIK